jgi:FecR protein
MSQNFDKERLKELVHRLCDGRIASDEVAELEGVLAVHQKARKLFHLIVAVHRDLGACDITSVSAAAVSTTMTADKRNAIPDTSATGTSTQRSFRRRFSVAASIAAALLLMTGYVFFRSSGHSPATVPLATITNLSEVNWPDSGAALQVGDDIEPSRIRFDSGDVCFTYAHGISATIKGPADVEFVSQEHLKLHRGTLVAYVPPGSEGFRVSTRTTDVVDLGTEFGITVSNGGNSEVIVFDGEVELSTSDTPNAQRRRISAGLAWRIDRNGTARQAEFRPSNFEQPRSLLRNRRVIREAFRNDNSFPGSKRLGWSGPWSLEAINFVIDETATGIHSENPLFPGTRNYLTLDANPGLDKSKACLRLSRAFGSFDQFDLSQPYTIEFVMRFESNPSSIRQVQITAENSGAQTNTKELWQARAFTDRTDTAELSWQLNRGDDNADGDAVLPIIRGRPYRFLIAVNPQEHHWRLTISDGRRTIRSGTPLKIAPSPPVTNVLLQWEVNSDPDADLCFSLDAIHIRNRPTQFPLQH